MTEPELPLEPSETDPSPLGYAEAVNELEAIVAELEREAVDVDHLSNRVRRAAELVELLQTRITEARMEVSRVLTDLDPGFAGTPPESSDGATPGDRR